MTAKEAYKLVIEFFDGDDSGVPVGIREYEKMYGFFIAPKGTKPGDSVFVGSMICVMKDGSEVSLAMDLEDQSFHRRPWKEIDPKEVLK